MAVQGTGSRYEEVAVGLIGGESFVRRMVSVARQSSTPGLRVEPAVYRHESEAPQLARQVMERVDVLLFAGPLPYDLTMAKGDLSVPAVFVPPGSAALHAALVRATSAFDPTRISVDSVTEQDVEDCYAEVSLPVQAVRVQPYQEELEPADYLAFHSKLFKAGRTVGAVTTIAGVAESLEADGVPTVLMRPSTQTLRETLRAAILTGSGARLSRSRIAIVIAQVPDSALPTRTSPAQYWYQELKLSLHHELLHDARRMDAIVLPHDQTSFLVITTLGSLRTITGDLETAPFLARVRETLNLDLQVGIGLGRSTLEAENNAYRAVAMAAADTGDLAYLVGSDDLVLKLPAESDAEATAAPVADETRDLETLRMLVQSLDETGDEARLVDAEQVAGILGVTLRTARRTLRGLVDSGLAWPMPATRAARKVGRPPMVYQLLDERLKNSGS
ncbi:hypothetical protein ACFWUU_23735 [Kribbella sp. NPDC058693]|uniref:hypothetical protein n=1 Tax=Kribbella sp. NPDC058693 TaxID=3346602 RepID=UPI0036524048